MEKQILKEFEIWLGSYSLGQGYDPPTKPELIAKVKAFTFKIACFKYELQSTLDSIINQEYTGYVGDQSIQQWYNPQTMVNSWTGKYYETEAEALKTFK